MSSQVNVVLMLGLFTLGALLLVLLRNLPHRQAGGFRAADYGRKPLLTRWELAALGEMRHELPPSLHVCPQVRLADLVSIRPMEAGERLGALNRVASKSVDFAVIDSAGRVLLVVELDDRSHERADRRERDHLVDAVLGECGIPVRRVRPGQAVGALSALGGMGLWGQAVAQTRARSGQVAPALRVLDRGPAL